MIFKLNFVIFLKIFTKNNKFLCNICLQNCNLCQTTAFLLTFCLCFYVNIRIMFQFMISKLNFVKFLKIFTKN